MTEATAPTPRAGQLWRAPSKKSYRYVRIAEVRERGTEDAYVNAVEVSEDGSKLRPTKTHPFRGQLFTVKLHRGAIQPPYEFVKEATT